MKRNLYVLFILIVTFSSIFFASCNKKPGEIYGVITYKESYTSISQPEGFAELRFIKNVDTTEKAMRRFIEFNGCFGINKSEYLLELSRFYSGRSNLSEKKIEDMRAHVDTISLSVYKMTNELMKKCPVVTIKADFYGNYRVSLPSGEYLVIAKSSHIKSLNLLEIDGNVQSQLVKLNAEERKQVDFEFTP